MLLNFIPRLLMTHKHRRRLHGRDGGDRPHSQKVVRAMPPKSPPQEFCYVAVVHSQKYSKNYECVVMKLKKVRRFSA